MNSLEYGTEKYSKTPNMANSAKQKCNSQKYMSEENLILKAGAQFFQGTESSSSFIVWLVKAKMLAMHFLVQPVPIIVIRPHSTPYCKCA